MKKKLTDINCTFMMSGTYSFESDSVNAAWKKAQGNLSLPIQREYVSDSMEIDSLDQCMIANGWDEEEVEDLSSMSKEDLVQEIDLRCELGIAFKNEAYSTSRLKEFLLDYYGIPYAPPKPTQPQPEQSSPERDVYTVLRNRNKAIDIKVYESIDDAKEYIKTDLQAEKESLSKKGIEPDIISSDELLFTQLIDQDSNHLVYWKIIQTGLIPKATPDIPSSAPQPVAVEQNKPPVVPTDIRIETSKGALIAREDLLSHGVWIDLRRPDANDDLPLAFVSLSVDESGTGDGCIQVEVFGEGKKDQNNKVIYFDGIDEYFQYPDHSPAPKNNPAELKIPTSLGYIVARAFISSAVCVELQRSNSDRMLPLICILENDSHSISIIVFGGGRKSHKEEYFVFDGIEDYFQMDDENGI